MRRHLTTIPSWVNEAPSCCVNSQYGGQHAGTALKLLAGILGSFAFQLVRPDGTAKEGADNILNILAKDNMPTVTQLSSYMWNISTLIPGIPVLAIMVRVCMVASAYVCLTHHGYTQVRYNLLNSGVTGPKMAFFLGVVAPWLLTMWAYQASMLVSVRYRCRPCQIVLIVLAHLPCIDKYRVLSLKSGLQLVCTLTIGVVNLIVPLLVYQQALIRYRGATSRWGQEWGQWAWLQGGSQSESKPLLSETSSSVAWIKQANLLRKQ